MYMMEAMIEMGLKEGQDFPSDAHRQVAMNLALGNPLITSRDALTDVVQKVCAIPETEIKTVKFNDLARYGLNVFVG